MRGSPVAVVALLSLLVLVGPPAAARTRGLPPSAASEAPGPATVTGSRGLADVAWVDADGVSHVGVDGTGQHVVQMEAYNADGHPALADCYGRTVVRALGQERDARRNPATLVSYTGHGAWTTGAICGSWDEVGRDFDGVAVGSRILHATLLHATSETDREDMQRSLQDAYGPRVITSSVGNADGTEVAGYRWAPFADGADMLHTQAIGNSGEGSGPPRQRDGRVLIVGALDAAGTAVSSYSSTGDPADPTSWPDIVAPGCMLLPGDGTAPAGHYFTVQSRLLAMGTDCPVVGDATLIEAVVNGYDLVAGTSFATPVVAGAAALMFQVAPELSGEDAAFLLTRTARHFLPTEDTDADGIVSPEEFHAQHGHAAGWGSLDITRAVAAANYWSRFGSTLEEAAACGTFREGLPALNPDGPCELSPT